MSRISEEKLRQIVRQSLQEGLLDDIASGVASGVGKAYDFVKGTDVGEFLGMQDKDLPGFYRRLDSFAADAPVVNADMTPEQRALAQKSSPFKSAKHALPPPVAGALRPKINEPVNIAPITSSTERNPFTGESSTEVVERLRKINAYNLSSSQLEAAALIEKVLRTEGFESPEIAAALVNAYHESSFVPSIKGDKDKATGEYHAFGLFQLYTPGGAGDGMTEAQMLDPVTNTRRIAQIAKSSAFWGISKETNDIPRLAADWSQYVESPDLRIKNMVNRAASAIKMFGLDML